MAAARDATNDPAVGAEVSGSPARWENGVAWQPNCPVNLGTWRACTDDAASGGPTKTLVARSDLVEADAYTIWIGDVCSTLGGLTQDRIERATEQLQNSQSKAMELILQNGLAGTTTQYLRDSNLTDLSPGGGEHSLIHALSLLEEAGSDAGTPFIHATLGVATAWYASRALERVGNLLYTALGTVVIPGAGYTGASPAGIVDATKETAYAYVTGQVQYRLGPVQVLGDERSIDRTTNTWEVRAERIAQATFDPCVQAGVRVNVCNDLCGANGS